VPFETDPPRRPSSRLHGGSLVLKVLLAVLLAAAAWWPALNLHAADQVEANLKRALTTYAVARGLNAAISVLQGTQVAIEPAGVGVVTTPGEALDPLNDLIEQFSSLMLWASVALGIELVLIQVGGHWVLCTLLGALAALWVIASAMRSRSAPAFCRLLLLAALLRFAVPLATLGTELIHREFLDEGYRTAQAQIAQSEQLVRNVDADLDPAKANPQPSQGMIDRLKQWMNRVPDLEKLTQQAKEAAERAIRNVVTLITIFVLETLILPLVFLAVLVSVGRAALGGRR